jgi:selenocysteine-specific elongation factor
LQIVIGTAGHIDHGKTALVKALTGTDTDSLAEEKARGMTIDLGFAYLDQSITIIDVPGHEKFIRNMVAGVSTIHIALLVVAADDGIMPQTKEHLHILKLLGLKQGIIAITKTDLISDPEWIDLIELDLRELISDTFLKDAPIFRTSVEKNEGIEDLKNEIIKSSKTLSVGSNRGFFHMPIDRVFSKVGFGTIVTGTVLSGKIRSGADLEVSPGNKKAKVRGLQTHGTNTSLVKMGDRAAINLSGMGLDDLSRGSIISEPSLIKETDKIIAKVSIISDTKWKLKNRQRIHLHIGTAEVLATVVIDRTIHANENSNVLFLLEKPLSILMDERFIIRSFSPMETIGGCTVLDPHPTFKRKQLKEWINNLEDDPSKRFNQFINMFWKSPESIGNWARRFHTNDNEIKEWIKANSLMNKKGLVFSSQSNDKSTKLIRKILTLFHHNNPYKKSLPKERIQVDSQLSANWLSFVLTSLESELIYIDGGFALKSHSVLLSEADDSLVKNIEKLLIEAGYNLPKAIDLEPNDEKKSLELLHILKKNKKVYEVMQGMWIHSLVWDKLIRELSLYFSTHQKIKISDFKIMTKTTRKNAIPLLEFLDKMKITERNGDIRVKGESCD